MLRVATAPDFPGISLKTAAGQWTGFEVELVSAVAADLGLKVEFLPTPMDNLRTMLDYDRADLAMSAQSITSTRTNQTDFTRPISCMGVAVVSKNPKIQTNRDLAGRSVAVVSGSIFQTYIQKLPFSKKIAVYPTIQDMIYAVISDKADATMAYAFMEPVIQKTFPKAGIHFGPEIWSAPQGFRVQENNAALLDKVNASLSKLMGNGQYAAISKKSFGRDVSCGR